METLKVEGVVEISNYTYAGSWFVVMHGRSCRCDGRSIDGIGGITYPTGLISCRTGFAQERWQAPRDSSYTPRAFGTHATSWGSPKFLLSSFRTPYMRVSVLILASVCFDFTHSRVLDVPVWPFGRSRHVAYAPEARGAYGESRGACQCSQANPVLLE